MIDHLSYSGLSTYNECGEKFRLTREIGVPEVPGWALVGGSAVHTATEVLDRQVYGLSLDDNRSTFREAFEQQIEKTVARDGVPELEWRISGKVSKQWPNKEDKDWWLFHGQSFVDNYIGWRNRYPGEIWLLPDGSPAIEIAIDCEIGSAHVTGFIDRVFQERDGTLRVVDLKAGRTTPTDGLQIATYGMGVETSTGMTAGFHVKHGSYFMARDGLLVGNYDLDQLYPRLQYIYDGAWQAINANYFPARHSFMCKFCPVNEWCWSENGALSEQVKPF